MKQHKNEIEAVIASMTDVGSKAANEAKKAALEKAKELNNPETMLKAMSKAQEMKAQAESAAASLDKDQ